MKLVHMLRTSFVAAALLAGVATSAWAQGGKLEVVGGDTYDWGQVAPGKLTTTIELKNIGEGDLKISRVQPGCGCTAAPIDKDVLKPGDIGKISVTLDMTNREGDQHKIITVYSDDSTNAAKVINLKANVKPVIQFQPVDYFLVNDAKVGVESMSSVKIVNRSDMPFTVFPPEIVQTNASIRLDLKKKVDVQAGQELELKVFITPKAAGSLNGTLRVKTSLKEYPQKDLTVYGTVAEPEASHSSIPPSPDKVNK